MFTISDNMASIDEKLGEAFTGITWVGELPLTERDFCLMADTVSMVGEHGAKYVPPRVLITSMVFCARYAVFGDDESINFWAKYFQDVVKKPKTQFLENDYRAAYRAARDQLHTAYQLEFPNPDQTRQEVVSGVYLHAILPAYLQDDFAQFFLKHYPNRMSWQGVDKLSPAEIALHNEAVSFAPPMLKRLIKFLQNTDTSITAARLIKTLVTAALWHSEGQNSDDIGTVLAPIEREIWTQMLPLLPVPEVDKTSATRPPSSRVRWAWLIEQNDILELHVKNLVMTSDNPPDRLVWFSAADGAAVKIGAQVPEYGRRYCDVNPYPVTKGYVIDCATLIDIDREGVVVPVDQQDIALSLPVPTGAPPTKEPAFFRVQSDGHLAILGKIDGLTDGDYAISLPEGMTLTAAKGGSVVKNYPLLIPKILYEQGHTVAACYTLSLPIMLGEKCIEKRRSRFIPTLKGKHPVIGLAPGSLPIYEQGDIWLLVSPPNGVPLEKLSLRLTANDTVSVHRLSELDAAGQITREIAHDHELLSVRLSDYLPSACLLQIEVYSGVSRMHGEPRLAGVLPKGIHIDASPVDRFYTPKQSPVVRIDGITTDQVELASTAQVESKDGSVFVTWVDPRQDAAVRLHINGVTLPLTFDVKWSYAWVTPLNGLFLWEDTLNEAVLSVRGAPRAPFYISVADGTPRLDSLNARGVMDVRVEENALVEMLRNYHGERAQVKLWFAGSDERIELFTLIRSGFSEFEKQPQLIKEAIRAFKAVMRYGRRQTGQLDQYWLTLLPIEYAASLPIDALPLILKVLREVKPGSHKEAQVILPQQTQRLCLSDLRSYAIQSNRDVSSITINRPHSEGQSSVILPIETRADMLHLRAPNSLLRQCLRCHDLFWADDKNAKLKHTHGNFGLEILDLTTEPLRGRVEVVPIMLNELRAFTPHFSPFIDRELEHSFRLRNNRARDLLNEPAAQILTHAAYAQATARWVLRLGSADINTQFAALYRNHAFVDQISEQLVQQESPILIIAGRWLLAERETRQTHDWQMLDPMVMTLAVVARAYAHGHADLLSEEQVNQFSLHLQNAYYCCPQLLSWALLWAEMIFTQWKKEEVA